MNLIKRFILNRSCGDILNYSLIICGTLKMFQINLIYLINPHCLIMFSNEFLLCQKVALRAMYKCLIFISFY